MLQNKQTIISCQTTGFGEQAKIALQEMAILNGINYICIFDLMNRFLVGLMRVLQGCKIYFIILAYFIFVS